ncbi:MAG: branched-chain amino acid ABC transporter permease [Haloferacaceae archaeon]
MSDDDRLGDGGAVVEAEAPPADPTIAQRYRRYSRKDSFVVVTTAIALVFFPFLLVDVLGAVGGIIGLSIGGYTGLPSLVLIYGIVVVGFNLLLGYTGLLSFGHAAFFGTAAYSAAIFSTLFPSPVVMVLVGTLVALVIAWPIGYVSIRRSGVYFAVLTLTFGQMLYFYALGPGAWLTNGDNGYSNIVIDGLFGVGAVPLELSVPLLGTMTYVFVAVLTVAAVALANRIVHSPYGLIFKALGENEQRVSFVGLNVFRYKHMAFIISAGYAGAGGALFVIHETYIHPTTGLYWITSGDFVIMTVLGGTGSLVGPMLGALIFEYISNVISGLSLPLIGSIGSLWRLILGAVFVFVVWVFPRGVYGALEDLGTAVLEQLDGEDGGEDS